MSIPWNRRRNSRRRGAAVAELAVCLPLLVLLAVASIEACAMIYLKQSLTIAAYEGARVALIPGSADVNVAEQCRRILEARRVHDASVAISPSVAGSAPGTFIAVTVQAPCRENSPIAGSFFPGRVLVGHVEMMKEL